MEKTVKYVFISQPMRNRTEEDIIAERNIIDGYYRIKSNDKVEFRIIDSLFLDKTLNDRIRDHYDKDANEGVLYLGESLRLLSVADIAIFLPNWYMARGCRVEYDTCRDYNIPIRFWEGMKAVYSYGGKEASDNR